MTRHPHDLASDPTAEHLAEAEPPEAELAAQDARGGGDALQAPRSLWSTGLVPDDESVASGEDWDDPRRL